ncbi:MAG: hypothetical protein U0802_19480 [Candidatus Binatia bacterium]
MDLEVQVRGGGVAGAADQAEELAPLDGGADGLGGQRIPLEVPVPRHRTVGVLDVDGVPVAGAEAAAAIVVAVVLLDDRAGRGGDHGHLAGVHLVPAPRPQEVVDAG